MHQRFRSLALALLATIASICPSAHALADDGATTNERVVFLGRVEPAVRNLNVPSSMFARYMMHSQASVSEIEAGVIAVWMPAFEHPNSIFVVGDEFEAYGICAKRKTVGCAMDVFDFDAGEVRRYHMPLSLAQRMDTYAKIVNPAE